MAQVNIESLDVRVHPQAASLPPPITVKLQPGDALFLPGILECRYAVNVELMHDASSVHAPVAHIFAHPS